MNRDNWLLAVLAVGIVIVCIAAARRERPASNSDGECVEFKKPHPVLCDVDRVPVAGDQYVKVCFEKTVGRWTLTSSAGRRDTVIGARCFTYVREY